MSKECQTFYYLDLIFAYLHNFLFYKLVNLFLATYVYAVFKSRSKNNAKNWIISNIKDEISLPVWF